MNSGVVVSGFGRGQRVNALVCIKNGSGLVVCWAKGWACLCLCLIFKGPVCINSTKAQGPNVSKLKLEGP